MKINDYNISDLMSFKNTKFYQDNGNFLTISDFIASYENHPQQRFNVLAEHDKDSTPEDIERIILRNALLTVGSKEEQDEDCFMGSIEDLYKLSSCTHWMEKYHKKESDKIKQVSSNCNGKWYFQSDQRCELVKEFCENDSRIACEVPSWEEGVIAQGLDPQQEKFNRVLIDYFNSPRIDDFKNRYQNLINRTFGDVEKKEIV